MEINSAASQSADPASARPRDQLVPPEPAEVQQQLDAFWRQLAGLARLAPRDEYLLLQELVDEMRRTVLALMLALNGIKRPDGTVQLNSYLGDSQRAAINSTLSLPETSRESYVAQAVALVVIYRWYAPQLIARYNLTYPGELERAVWQQLRESLFDWPATITTDDAAPSSSS